MLTWYLMTKTRQIILAKMANFALNFLVSHTAVADFVMLSTWASQTFRQLVGLPNSLVYCDSFLWLAWHANPWVSSEWWLKQSLKPSAFQLWYITFCPPLWLTLNPWIREKNSSRGEYATLSGGMSCVISRTAVIWLSDCRWVWNVRHPRIRTPCPFSMLICKDEQNVFFFIPTN